ncbi:sensor histidine kinase [Paenibacillus sp. 481]|uniref:sensor histidine kinase n=1 Tax=Paenibacillus sp. 481 TaxID=2835869 RepID=UPI001E5B3697|nr:sensor histidine kinase [Paenibacillus sp. 481]UHA74946.1 sensor histidine kinase [Paenibacillus sp. 481]
MKLACWLYQQYTKKTQFRLTIYFLIVLLPLVTVSLIANLYSRDIVLNQAMNRGQDNLNVVSMNMDMSMHKMENYIAIIADNQMLMQRIKLLDSQLTPSMLTNLNEITTVLSDYITSDNPISQISLYHNQSGMLISTKHGPKAVTEREVRACLEQIASRSQGNPIFIHSKERICGKQTFGGVTGTNSVSLVKTIDFNNPDRAPYILVITISKTEIRYLLESFLVDEYASVEWIAKDGTRIAKVDSSGGEAESAFIHKKPYLTIKSASEDYLWQLVMLLPLESMLKETERVHLYTYAIIGISILLSITIAWSVYTRIASPLQTLSGAMKQLRLGNYDYRLQTDRQDEFGYLMHAYNEMAQQQKHLIQDHYEQQLMLAHAELKFLQSQINPHFLYNTLDSIYWTAKNYDAEEISDMVIHLSRFYRLSLDKGEETVTVEQTFSHMHDYIRIQQIRLLDSFQVEYDIAEDSKMLPVLKLLLQPLVENAIIHGLVRDQQDARLLLTSNISNEYLLLAVEDNGIGMSVERLRYIQSELGSIHKNKDKPLSLVQMNTQDLYGLRNVLSRMKLVYGEEASLMLNSKEEQGTIVTLCIPITNCRQKYSWSAEHVQCGLVDDGN